LRSIKVNRSDQHLNRFSRPFSLAPWQIVIIVVVANQKWHLRSSGDPKQIFRMSRLSIRERERRQQGGAKETGMTGGDSMLNTGSNK